MTDADTLDGEGSSGEEKGPGLGDRILGFFVETPKEGGATEGAEDSASSESTPEATASTAAAATGGESTGGAGVLKTDFPTLHAKMGTAGDPNADTFLEAYAGMSAMDEAARRIAMAAMAKGMHADVAAVIATLEKRAGALAFVVRKQSNAAKERQDAQTAALEAQRATTESRVSELQGEIARLQGELDAKVQEAKGATAADAGAIQGFKARVANEAARLQSLQQFLGALGKK